MFKKKLVLLIILTALTVSKALAQDPEDGPEGPPQASIDNFLLPLFIGAIIIGGYFIYKGQKKSAIIN